MLKMSGLRNDTVLREVYHQTRQICIAVGTNKQISSFITTAVTTHFLLSWKNIKEVERDFDRKIWIAFDTTEEKFQVYVTDTTGKSLESCLETLLEGKTNSSFHQAFH